jgi:hypothetical protein
MRPPDKKRRVGTTRNPLGGPSSKGDCYNCLARFASLRKRLVGVSDYVGADCLRVIAQEFRGEGDDPLLAEIGLMIYDSGWQKGRPRGLCLQVLISRITGQLNSSNRSATSRLDVAKISSSGVP